MANRDASMQAEAEVAADVDQSGSIGLEKQDLYRQSDKEYALSEGDAVEEELVTSRDRKRVVAQMRNVGGAVSAFMTRPAKSSRWEDHKGVWQKKREAETSAEDL